MTPERKEYLKARRKRHKLDDFQAEVIKALRIVDCPMDIAELERAVIEGKGLRGWGTGYDWLDKKHRVAFDAIKEIRALRAKILELIGAP